MLRGGGAGNVGLGSQDGRNREYWRRGTGHETQSETVDLGVVIVFLESLETGRQVQWQGQYLGSTVRERN